MKNFALIGAAGYIAPRHLKAIKETNNNLIAALDKFDSVGILDSYFPKADFFTEFERFDRHLYKIKIKEKKSIDFVSICTPNYLHDSHIRMALRIGADAICEKPLVLNPWNIDALQELEEQTNNKIWNILQLRLHPSVLKLKERVAGMNKKLDVDLTYITSRGHWYYTSWKGDISKSGGIATNIGIHFFDMLTFVFGNMVENTVHIHTHDRASGFLELEGARVRWFLSINEDNLPEEVRKEGKTTYRALEIDNEVFEFSNGFSDLHTTSYEKILTGSGFGLEDARKSIEIVHQIRHNQPIGIKGNYHPFAKKELSKHPFNRS